VQHDKIYCTVQDPALRFPKKCKPDLPNSHFPSFCSCRAGSQTIWWPCPSRAL